MADITLNLQEDLVERVDTLAQRLCVPREEVVSRALQDWLFRNDGQTLTEELNATYADDPQTEQLAVARAMRRKLPRLPDAEW